MGLELRRVQGQALRVDCPHPNRRRFGVPAGGPFDEESAQLGFQSLDVASAEQWEVYGSAEFRITAAGTIVHTGARHALSLDGVRIRPRSLFVVDAGQVLHARADSTEARAYLTFAPKSVLYWTQGSFPKRVPPLRFVPGPDSPPFAREGWRVTPHCDRIGLRLEGPAEPHTIELPSRPTTFGTIQVPPGGQPILLGPDGPTIGGYPQAGVILSLDLPAVAQLLPGAEVSFMPVTRDEAVELVRKDQSERETWRALREEARQLMMRGVSAEPS
jgi:allophanate hydrolase subunit 2